MDKMPYILALGVVTVLLLLQNLGVLPLLGGDGGVVDGLALALAGAGFLAGLLTAGRLYPPPTAGGQFYPRRLWRVRPRGSGE